eukprot:1726609-Amphidinium_carterae.1
MLPAFTLRVKFKEARSVRFGHLHPDLCLESSGQKRLTSPMMGMRQARKILWYTCAAARLARGQCVAHIWAS